MCVPHSANGDKKKVLMGVSFLFLPCGFQELNSWHQAWQLSPFTSHLIGLPLLRVEVSLPLSLPWTDSTPQPSNMVAHQCLLRELPRLESWTGATSLLFLVLRLPAS